MSSLYIGPSFKLEATTDGELFLEKARRTATAIDAEEFSDKIGYSLGAMLDYDALYEQYIDDVNLQFYRCDDGIYFVQHMSCEFFFKLTED